MSSLREDKTTRQQLLHRLRGRTLVVPDLQAILRPWPQAVNPNLGRLQNDVDRRLEMYVRYHSANQEATQLSGSIQAFPPKPKASKNESGQGGFLWRFLVALRVIQYFAYCNLFLNLGTLSENTTLAAS